MDYLTSWFLTAQVEITKNLFWFKDISLLVCEYLQEHYIFQNCALIPKFIVEQKFQECIDILSHSMPVIYEHNQHLPVPLGTYSIQHFQSKLNYYEYSVELSRKFRLLELQTTSQDKIKKVANKYVDFCQFSDIEYTQYLLEHFQKVK